MVTPKKALACFAVTVMLVGCASKAHVMLTEDEVENLSDETMIEIVKNPKKYAVDEYYAVDDFGVPLAEKEKWFFIRHTSASSVEEAEEAAAYIALAQESLSKYTTEYIGENDYYYEVRLTYTEERATMVTFIDRMIVFKESVLFCAFGENGYYSEFRALDRETVFNILDLSTRFDTGIIYKDFAETESEYVRTSYEIEIINGDWGLNDSARLRKTRVFVDKETGKKTYEGRIIKEIEIEGTRDYNW